jgi:sulfide dehydrogenase cytochrome subunit
MKFLCLSMLTLAVGFSGSALCADLAALTAECESCHGPNGVSAHGDVPSIGGQPKDFIDDTLHSFQVWGRPCIKSLYRHGDTSKPKTDMCKIASGLSEEDIVALSGHYSALPFIAAPQEFDASLVEAGAALHEEHCSNCHANGGREAGRGPILAGQWTPYLRSTLKFVPTGEHMVPGIMERTLDKFSEDELNAILNFFASQQN